MNPISVFIRYALLFAAAAPVGQQSGSEQVPAVDIVMNSMNPSRINGTYLSLVLNREYALDTEASVFAKTGLTDIIDFDVDSEDNLYVLVPLQGDGDFIFHFKNGRFIKSFGRKGQGPGEMQYPFSVHSTGPDRLVIGEPPNKFLFYSGDGKFIAQSMASYIDNPKPLKNGRWIGFNNRLFNADRETYPVALSLYSPDMKEIRELDRYSRYPNPMAAAKSSNPYINAAGIVLFGCVSDRWIFAGSSERGYEIRVHEPDGRLVRIIKKEYRPVRLPSDFRAKILKPYENVNDPQIEALVRAFYFPEFWPPYHSFFADEIGRLYVVTYETDEKSGNPIVDIFSPDGVLAARQPIPVLYSGQSLDRQVLAKVRNSRLYTVREKESGYKELVCYKMTWDSR